MREIRYLAQDYTAKVKVGIEAQVPETPKTVLKCCITGLPSLQSFLSSTPQPSALPGNSKQEQYLPILMVQVIL